MSGDPARQGMMRRLGSAGYIGRMSFTMLRRTGLLFVLVSSVVLGGAAGCADNETSQKVAQAFQPGLPAPDEVPRMLNTELPFRYPAALYARKVQGNVTLRLRIDRDGQVSPDSTRIDESSGHVALDSAALAGTGALRFEPARHDGKPVTKWVLLPVEFNTAADSAARADTTAQKALTQ